MQNLKILIPANLIFSAGVRDLVQEAASQLSFENRQKNMLRLVVDELFMNAIRYGSNMESHVFIEAVIDKDEEQLIFAIEDEGKGAKTIKAEELKNIIENEKNNDSLQKTHGRGLAQITSELVHAFDVQDKENGGLRVEFIMKKNINIPKRATSTKAPQREKILGEKEMHLEGEIDLNNLQEVINQGETILNTYKNTSFRLILNCEKLRYCNSTFLGVLAGWQSQLIENGGEAVIRNPSQDILEIFDLVGLTQIFIIENTNQSQFKPID